MHLQFFDNRINSLSVSSFTLACFRLTTFSFASVVWAAANVSSSISKRYSEHVVPS